MSRERNVYLYSRLDPEAQEMKSLDARGRWFLSLPYTAGSGPCKFSSISDCLVFPFSSAFKPLARSVTYFIRRWHRRLQEIRSVPFRFLRHRLFCHLFVVVFNLNSRRVLSTTIKQHIAQNPPPAQEQSETRKIETRTQQQHGEWPQEPPQRSPNPNDREDKRHRKRTRRPESGRDAEIKRNRRFLIVIPSSPWFIQRVSRRKGWGGGETNNGITPLSTSRLIYMLLWSGGCDERCRSAHTFIDIMFLFFQTKKNSTK